MDGAASDIGADSAAEADTAASETGPCTEDQALARAQSKGNVPRNATPSQVKGAIGEELGWTNSLDNGEIGIRGPRSVARNGADYITYDPESNMIRVWDAKYSTAGRFPGGDSLPITKMDGWSGDIGDAVDGYDGPYADEIRSAYNDGNVSGHYFKYTPGG